VLELRFSLVYVLDAKALLAAFGSVLERLENVERIVAIFRRVNAVFPPLLSYSPASVSQ